MTHCIVFLLEWQWGQVAIQQVISQLRQVRMRMELKPGINDCYLLDDSYSNDLAGLEIALNYLLQQDQHKKYTVILSDLLQSSLSPADLYAALLKLLQAFPIGRLILIGPACAPQRHFFEKQGWDFQHFADTDTFLDLEQLDACNFQHENILVKGARVFAFEKIVQRL